MNQTPKIRSIRFPENVWKEIMDQAEMSDRSFNRVVVRMLQKQIEREKQKESKAI